MSLRSFEAHWPQQPGQQLRSSLLRRQRQVKHWLQRVERNSRSAVKRQYYLTDALADSRRAFHLNEDIVLACLIITAVLSFAATSILANATYDFMLAASALSVAVGGNLVVLVVLGMGVVGVCLLQLLAALENSLSITLMEGATRKRKCSVRSTIRKSLRLASRTAIAWLALMSAALLPGSLLLTIAGLVMHVAQIKLATALFYMAAAAVFALAWASAVLANYSLVPFVMLFDNPDGWLAAVHLARKLVYNKGRLFIVSLYIMITAFLASLYFLSQWIPNGLVACLFLSVFVLSLANACLTMLYRKRKLARK